MRIDSEHRAAGLRRHWPWLALVALSLALHLWGLGERSFHHDDAIHAHATYKLLKEGVYRYDPTYHGPLLYYLSAGTFAVLGDSDFTARLPVAMAGVLLIAVAWGLRRPFGERAAWWTALLVTVSPSCLYYGRFMRMDLLELLVASAAVVAVYRAARGSPSAWLWAGAWTALAFATKENAYVTAAVVVGVWLVMTALALHRGALQKTLAFVDRHRWGLIGCVAVAVLVAVPLFTVGFKHPGDWFFPGRAISYWWNQHSIARVAGPWWYHLPRLALYEFLPIVLTLAWIVRRWRRLRRIELTLLLFAASSVAMYAYLREKVPWLVVHQLWAFLPLAGCQLARSFGPQGRWWSRSLAGAGLAVTMCFSWLASFPWREISPNLKHIEMLTYVQTCPELIPIVDEGLRLAEQGVDPVAAVDGDAGWPLTWYWRKVPVWWDAPKGGMRPPLVLANPGGENRLQRRLGPEYSVQRLPLRAWWLIEQQAPSLGQLLRYLVTRAPWSEVGSSDFMLYRHTGEQAVWIREAEPPPTLAAELTIVRTRVIGEGWLEEPRGIALRADGTVAVADVAISSVLVFDSEGNPSEAVIPAELQQPEAVAWTPDGLLAIADTWGHRVLLVDPATGAVRPLPPAPEGWYGPRGVAAASDGALAAADTGNKRLVLMTSREGVAEARTLGGPGNGAGEYVEPVGVSWLSDERLLVCDTGNHRLQVVDREGAALRVVELPGGWTEFYSRPQVVALTPDLWLATDTPASALWIVREGRPHRLDLSPDGITPTGVAAHGSTLALADLEGRVWIFDLKLNS
jgi:uncharacterized protein (TIGR03663 family)